MLSLALSLILAAGQPAASVQPSAAGPVNVVRIPGATDGPTEIRVRLRCVARANGAIERCRVIENTAKGDRYDDVAVRMSRTMRIKPLSDGSSPDDRMVEIPFLFVHES